ncbi:MAG: hypothetical protein U5K79_03025 [Cyclobacteriaceae bacterium]|nr:hypothetical protein [Cyclobacteriaceae bacterium]
MISEICIRRELLWLFSTSALVLSFISLPERISAQVSTSTLPLYAEDSIHVESDWLIDASGAIAKLYRDSQGNLVVSNGLLSRTISTFPDGATISYLNMVNDESLIRSVRPEAAISIDGYAFEVGGLYGQPVHNYLLPEWLESMTAQKGNFHLKSYTANPIRERFAWKKRLEWMPQDLPWPPPGIELTFTYQLDDLDVEEVYKKAMSDAAREIVYTDDFNSLNKNWTMFKSPADERTSFINEGKPGEIMALSNTSVFAEQPVPKNAEVIMVTMNPGTDRSSVFGPGMVLAFKNRNVKINLRPADNSFGFYDGEKLVTKEGLMPGRAVTLRWEFMDDHLVGAFSYDKKNWTAIGKTTLLKGEFPTTVRIGKTDWVGESSDQPNAGTLVRCKIESFEMLGAIPKSVKSAGLQSLEYLKNITVEVHYELYDHIPLMCKWITVENKSQKSITINSFKSEILAVTDAESNVDQPDIWRRSKLMVESDYAFGDGMSPASCLNKSVFWNKDPLYLTQVNYVREAPYLLECYPEFGPEQTVAPNQQFESFRAWELAQKNYDQERQGLERRKMYRVIAPWITENPVLMHVRQADDASVKSAIDQCAEVGFEMVIMTFGSGFNVEDQQIENIDRMKALADYAHAKGVALGGYSLLASRSIDKDNDVIMPEGQHPTFGNSPCLESQWGQEYFSQLYNFYQNTGLDILEHDGSYPGDECYSTNHPGHKGLQDSQWNQRKRITDFYKWSRGQGIYLNIPDWYFLNGSNKTGMGYRETNWSLSRKQQEIIERQNVYDGTWNKTPSMGWMFVPLVQYHGGGTDATIEPLKDHLPHYEQRLANLFGAGVQACYRGPRLYDSPETKAIVEKWVGFYKKHRAILDSDVIHIRRPDGQDYDGLLHVNPQLEEKGLLMLYNPLETPIKKTINVNLYYTGLDRTAKITKNDTDEFSAKIKRDYSIDISIEIPSRGWTWYVIR